MESSSSIWEDNVCATCGGDVDDFTGMCTCGIGTKSFKDVAGKKQVALDIKMGGMRAMVARKLTNQRGKKA